MVAATMPATLAIGRVYPQDLAYVRNSFSEGHKGAPDVLSMTWRHYKTYIVPVLRAVLAQQCVELRAAYLGPDIVGWIAFTRGKRVDAVHWVHTRYRIADGPELRRRGVMTALLNSIELGSRIAYTWKGAIARSDHDKRTVDERLLPWLSRRGQHAVYVPWEEWIQ